MTHMMKAVKMIENGSIPADKYDQTHYCGTARCVFGWAYTLAFGKGPKRQHNKWVTEKLRFIHRYPMLGGLIERGLVGFDSFQAYFKTFPKGEPRLRD